MSRGQFAVAEFQVGWKLKDVDGIPYSDGVLRSRRDGISNYRIRVEKHVPTREQMDVLTTVRERVEAEFRVRKEQLPRAREDAEHRKLYEPLRGLVHGLPGTGKSKVISFIKSFFIEALGWKYGEDFIFVAFQNRVAYAMGGQTLHNAANIDIGSKPRLNHTDVDMVFTRNRHLKWVLIDEVGMISDVLLGAFETALTDATDREERYKRRSADMLRLFGGYNLLMLGDFNQLKPLPPGAAVFLPPTLLAKDGPKQDLPHCLGDGVGDGDSLPWKPNNEHGNANIIKQGGQPP